MNTNNNKDEDPRGNAGVFHMVHADRDPASNWAVDLNTLLEEYLAKICNGEIHGGDDSDGFHVNFAEAALLLQGSVQVYSRKVEYLYSLVLHALEFISEQRQQDEVASTSIQPEESTQHNTPSEDDEPFWGFEDVPAEANNCLDSSTYKDAPLNFFVKPPADLVVLEGDCLDTSGDAGELESYLLATTNLFRDFVLLDPCDSIAVNEFLEDAVSKGIQGVYRDSSIRKDFQSPTARSGGAHKSSAAKNHHAGANHSPGAAGIELNFDAEYEHLGHGNEPDNELEFHMFNGSVEPGNVDDSDDDLEEEENDPWKPLDPHVPGNLKVKPFRKVKTSKKPGTKSTKMISIMARFPTARIHGTINSEFMHLWEKRCATHDEQKGSESPPLFEKLRETLIHGGCNPCNDSGGFEDTYRDDGYDGHVPDFTGPDVEMPEDVYMDDQPGHDMHGDAIPFQADEPCGQEDSTSNSSLEDLCRSHLDAFLASIAETETQTELAARVSSWKQKIEHNLEEQDSHPPFDIHEYGERILSKLSHEADERKTLSFADIVQGQEKHDVARSFSALLQLVNNGDVDLGRPGAGESVCYTFENPFYVRLLGSSQRLGEKSQRPSKRRVKSPLQRGRMKADCVNLERQEVPYNSASKLGSRDLSSQSNGKFPIKLGKVGGLRCTPDGKRRRRSRYVEPVNLNSAS